MPTVPDLVDAGIASRSDSWEDWDREWDTQGMGGNGSCVLLPRVPHISGMAFGRVRETAAEGKGRGKSFVSIFGSALLCMLSPGFVNYFYIIIWGILIFEYPPPNYLGYFDFSNIPRL